MTKYEPNFFVFPSEKEKRIEDKIRKTPVICKDEPLGAGALAMFFLNDFLSQEQKDAIILEKNKSQILPGKLQEKAQIVTLKNETLILQTNSSVWRAEIAAIKANIIFSANKILGKEAVKAVKVG
ncbi:MAG: DUF721 domain-containing protein [Fibromonadales bacterium]|nr:DUF721 domain-containing protein [Fibromonadales bacterium]